jgi:hypothetical protein
MKNLRLLLFLICYLIIPANSQGQSIYNSWYGGELTYKDLGNDSFLVTYTCYYECDNCYQSATRQGCGTDVLRVRGPWSCSTPTLKYYLKGVSIEQLDHSCKVKCSG